MKQNDIIKNKVTGLVVQVLNPGTATQCCSPDATILDVMTRDGAVEKHVPVVVATEHGIKVTVGSVPHPMDADHFIEFIEVVNGPYVNRKHLKPGEAPVAEFYVPMQPGLEVRAYCNKHGLWKAD